MTKAFRVAVLSAVLSLSSAGVFAASEGVITECKLAEAAYKMVKASGQQPHNDILVGCPGYEDWQPSMSKKENSGAFMRAGTAPQPEKVKAAGKAGKIIFTRMIARGVPVDVATALVDSPEFDRALAGFGK